MTYTAEDGYTTVDQIATNGDVVSILVTRGVVHFVDVSTGDMIGSSTVIEGGYSPRVLAVLDNSVWAMVGGSDLLQTIETDGVSRTSTGPQERSSGVRTDLAAGAGALWAVDSSGIAHRFEPTQAGETLSIRLDPGRGDFYLDSPTANIAASDSAVWATYLSVLFRIDPNSGEAMEWLDLSEIDDARQYVLDNPGGPNNKLLAADDRFVWAILHDTESRFRDDNVVVRLDASNPTEPAEVFTVPYADAIAGRDGTAWVCASGLYRIGPNDSEPVEMSTSGCDGAVAVDENRVWFDARDNAAIGYIDLPTQDEEEPTTG